MEENTFNYIDNLNSSAYREFSSSQHDNAIQLTGRKAYIFLLDKVDTETTVYGEEKTGRVYLPHFVLRGLYKTNTFRSSLSVINYSDMEDNMEIEFNFDRMVNSIHENKVKPSGKLIITSKSKIPLTISINDNLIIKRDRAVIFEKELNSSIYQFIDEFKKECNLLDLVYIGNTEPATSIEKINKVINPRRKIELNVFNSSFNNTTDVIENGTVIVTDRYRAYEVVGAYPTTDSFGNYISWTCQCQLVNMARIDGLPQDFNQLIKNNQYNLGKYNVE